LKNNSINHLLTANLIYLIVLLFFLSCTTTPSATDGLIKLTADEMVDRIRNGVFANSDQVHYFLESGDSISFDSLLILEQQSPIVLDEYVNSNGVVVVSIIRRFSEKDKVLRSRIQTALLEYRIGELNGTIKIETIESKFLSENRFLNIYLPKNITENSPIIYMMDGGYFDETLKKIDKLVSENKIIPFIMVGVPSSENRFKEYIFNKKTSDHFNNHMSFFTKEVIEHVENNLLKLNTTQNNRYIAGNSNGGDFSILCALQNPSLFNEALSFSGVALRNQIDLFDFNEIEKTTSFYIGAGTKELEVLSNNKYIQSKLRNTGFDVNLIEYNSDHNAEMWMRQFLEYLIKRFSV